MVKRGAWIEAGLSLLCRDGNQRLTVERLCDAMEKTKGSFYHHFDDMAAFEDALLASWKQAHTLAPIDIAEGLHGLRARSRSTVAERRRALYRAVGRLDLRLEVAVRAWAVGDARARCAQLDVDRTRVTYLVSLWGKGKRAQICAELEYAAFLGLLSQHGAAFPKHAHLMEALLRALEP